MELPVTLAGHQVSWAYRGSRDLRAWIESQPWLRGGGLVRVHLGANADVDLFVDGVRRAVRAADEAGHQPVVVPVTVIGSLIGTLYAELFGLDRVDERRLISECSFKNRLFIALTDSGGRIAAEAGAFSDGCGSYGTHNFPSFHAS